jgi:Fe-S cluster assembly protein SufD
VVVGRDASLELNLVFLHGFSADVPMTVDLAGEGSSVQVNCLFLCKGEDRLDFNVVMHHRVGHCTSRQVFDGLLGGSSNAVFDGKIIVAPDAQKTEAYQESHNILLSEEAKIDTRPQLEIYADDVKCSHGSTVGQLNDAALFYMQQRGVTLHEARLLLQNAFINEVIDKMQLLPLRDRLHYLVEKRFRGELNKCTGCQLCK